MAWYRTGTISLTNGSTAVAGSGTAWISNAAVGEALLAPDGKLYEISNIGSNTSITLGSAYLGTTQSGQAYVIVPSQSYIRDLAAQAASLVNNYSTFYNTVGQGKFTDGAVATPAISFSNDTNTGLYRSEADEVTLVANGVAIAKWNTSGFSFVSGVSTITANSTSPALKITQTGTGNALVVEDAASDTTPFVIDQNGNVAIRSSPGLAGASLTVGGDTQATIDVFRPTADTGGPGLRFVKNRNTNIYAHTIVNNGDTLGAVQFFGSDGAANIQGAAITAQVDGTTGTNDMPGRLVFSTTADGASSPTERMRIGSDGGVSIGTTYAAGANILRVVNTLLATDRLEINGLGTGNRYACIDLVGDDTYTDFGFRIIRNNSGPNASVNVTNRGTGGILVENIEAAPIAFSTSAAIRMQIDSSGNVLVKTAAGLGYGTGAGGAVTQATNKSTAVTLNRPCGQITMHDAALAANTSVAFTLNNSVFSATDNVIVQLRGGITQGAYQVWAEAFGTGTCAIVLRNISGASLSEAVVINFSVIKGSTA